MKFSSVSFRLWAGLAGLLTLPLIVHADAPASLAKIRAQFAAKDAEINSQAAEITRLRQQVVDLTARISQKETIIAQKNAQITQKDAQISQFQQRILSLPLDQGGLPPAPTGKRWDTEITFGDKYDEAAEPHMDFTSSLDPAHRKASRPAPKGKTPEEYAQTFYEICQELGVPAKRIGASVFFVGAMASYTPFPLEVKNLDSLYP